MLYLASITIGYFLGSFNFGIILSKIIHKQDIRKMGSGNAGATNALRNFGPAFAILVFFFDMLKGVAAVLITKLFYGGNDTLYLLAGLFAVIGHLYPIYYKFKGGKGVATTSGVVIIVEPVVASILFGILFLISFASRYISLASVCAITLYPILVYFIYDNSIEKTIFAAIIALLVIFKHRSNIRRLIKGEENKISLKSKGKNKK